MKQSEVLTEFYRALQSAIEADFEGERHLWVDRKAGICWNLCLWTQDSGMRREAEAELIDQFVSADFESGIYPFQEGKTTLDKGDSYKMEQRHNLVYKNEKRLAWIKEHSV